ncbi:ATP-binding protein [Pseudomonas sp. NPDC088368]|jgi:signal transduction histidine kinase|uniref:ATP-binding protein n=1 Tax=Pseudomonas sp. NPDC088368 TaxID=3364453 RepID=UPI0037FEB88F
MMSLRTRLSLTLGSAFIVIWVLAAAWMLRDLRMQMMESLDQRLEASARMVAGLLEQMQMPTDGDGKTLRAGELSIPNGMACQLSSLRGQVLARTESSPAEPLKADSSGFVDQMINGEHWRVYTMMHGNVRVSTADRQIERDVLGHSVLLAASVPVLVALFGSLILVWFGIGRGLAPLNRMRDALNRHSADSVEPLDVPNLPSELQPLLVSQNQLFQRIAQTLERERRLTGDAAHELRSPLTAIKTHLQVARMTEGEKRDRSLAHAEEGADRMHRTLEQLLLLARVEGSLSFDDGVQCDAEKVARLAIHDANHGDDSRIELILPSQLSTAPVEMPAALAVAALRNLLDNALRHTQAGARVELSVETFNGHAHFRVRDYGPGIPEPDLDKLTQRFWRNGKSPGAGLGLAIVQAIVQRCDCSLKFDSRSDGLRVELSVPLRRSGA